MLTGAFFSLSLLFFQFYNKISNRTRCRRDCAAPITSFSPCKHLQDILCRRCHERTALQRPESFLFEASLCCLCSLNKVVDFQEYRTEVERCFVDLCLSEQQR